MPTLVFDQTNQVATVPAPDTEITIQEVYDQFVDYEAWAHVMLHPQAIVGGGKFDYGTGEQTVVSIRLLDWKLAFEARPGPTWVECRVTGGNLSAVDGVGSPTTPIQGTDYVTVQYAQATTGAILETAVSGLTPAESQALLDIDANVDALDTKVDTLITATAAMAAKIDTLLAAQDLTNEQAEAEHLTDPTNGLVVLRNTTTMRRWEADAWEDFDRTQRYRGEGLEAVGMLIEVAWS